MTTDIESLIDRVDLDGLIRLIDGFCTSRNWSDILKTRDLCRSATRTGRQVWPIATLCEYRLALLAPPSWSCQVVDNDVSRFSIGPLTEVLAQNHTWSEVRDLLSPGPHREIVAHERALRGDIIEDTIDSHSVLDLPFDLAPWEPEYPRALYSEDGVVAPCPCDTWVHEWVDVGAASAPVIAIDDDDTTAALRSLVEPWTSASMGRAECTIVEGRLDALASSLSLPALRVSEVSTDQALQWLAWCGASGGSHGRRRGSAAGRFNCWWLLAALAGLGDDWDTLQGAGRLAPVLGEATTSLTWYRVDLGRRHSYELSLAAVNLEENLVFGLFAHDDPL